MAAGHALIGSMLGGYRIDELVGRGGMGVVYRAEQLSLGRQVALKVIAPGLADNVDFRARFVRESRLAAAIEHPHVIPVYEAGEVDGALYIAMRYVEGTDLRAAIVDSGGLPPARAVVLAGQVADALDAAHSHGLVHRDVKPANVLLAAQGPDHAYLTDFGLTKHAASSGGLTGTGQWVGTADYVAPEQVQGGPIDARADVYALACLLFQCLTGQVPYPRDSDMAKMYAHVNDRPPSARAVRPELEPALDEVVVRGLAKNPDERFPSAGDLARAAEAASQGVPVDVGERTVARGSAAPAGDGAHPTRHQGRPSPPAAGSPPPGARTEVLGRRRRALPYILAATTLLALGGLVGVLIATGGPSEESAPSGAQRVESETPGRDRADAPATDPPATGTEPGLGGGGDSGTDSGTGAGTVTDWPRGTSAYTAILGSKEQREDADDLAARAADHGDVGILRSEDYSSLSPGYWVVFSGQFETSDEAGAEAARYQDRGFEDAYPRFVNGAE